MRNIEKIAQALFDKIRSRFERVTAGDDKAKATLDPEKARFLNFKYIGQSGNVFGDVTVSLIDDYSLKIYFSKGITEKLSQSDKHEWFEFLKDLRGFAKQNLLTFDTRDISRPGLSIKDVRQTSHADAAYDKEDVNADPVVESKLFGTSKSSYQTVGPARIIVRHQKPVNSEVHGSRARNIESVFIENAEGERFKLPFKKLMGARAMARHVSNGGQVHDDMGKHICETVNEMVNLGMFVRNHKNKVFEDSEAMEMIESAVERYVDLHKNLRQIGGRRGYGVFKENFKPEPEMLGEVDVDGLKEKFVKKLFDERLTPALEYVYKAHQRRKQLQDSYVTEFEQWANKITEGTWSVPETDDQVEQLNQLLLKPLLAGPDGDNATSALYDLVGDDELFDTIYSVSQTEGDDADIRPLVVGWLRNNFPEAFQKLSIPDELKSDGSEDSEQSEEPITPTAPSAPAPEPKSDKSVNDLRKLAGL